MEQAEVAVQVAVALVVVVDLCEKDRVSLNGLYFLSQDPNKNR